jgi:hypothetical protein
MFALLDVKANRRPKGTKRPRGGENANRNEEEEEEPCKNSDFIGLFVSHGRIEDTRGVQKVLRWMR